MNIRHAAVLAAASLAIVAAPASAQDTAVTTDPALATPVADADRDDDDFPWGLLGLLGLAGLLGRKRDRDDVRVNRTDTNRM